MSKDDLRRQRRANANHDATDSGSVPSAIRNETRREMVK